jgi:hypothetical protein
MPTVDPSSRQAWLLWASVFPVSWTALCVAWPALWRITLSASALGLAGRGFGRTGYEEIAKRCLIC